MNKLGSGQDLLSMREYLPNDDLRRIDWKATARSKTLMVREFAAEDDQKFTVYLDTRVPPETDAAMTIREKIEAENAGGITASSPRFERAVSQAADLVARLCNSQTEVRLATPGQIGNFGTGSRHLHECLRRLAVIEPDFQEDPGNAAFNDLDEIFTDTPESHNLLITAGFDESSKLPVGTQVIRF